MRRVLVIGILLGFSCFSTGVCRPTRSGATSRKTPPSKTSRATNSVVPKEKSGNEKSSVDDRSCSKKKSVSDSQQENLSKLQSDLAQLSSQSNVTSEQKQAFANSLQILAKDTVKPSKALVDSLANDVQSAVSDGNVSTKEQIKLLKDVQTVMNSANIPKSEVDAVINDANDILVSSGVSQEDTQLIVNDLKSISAELKKNSSSFVPSESLPKKTFKRFQR